MLEIQFYEYYDFTFDQWEEADAENMDESDLNKSIWKNNLL